MPTSAKVKPRPVVGVDYPWTEAPGSASVLKVAAGVWWLRMPLPFALDHINLWLLEGDDGWTIVDCGFGSDETRELWRGIFAAHLGGKPVIRVIVTHFHPDHFGLAAWLADQWRIPVLMTEPEFALAQGWHSARDPYTRRAHEAMFEKHGLRLDEDRSLPRQPNLFRRGVPALPDSITPLHDRQILPINGQTWRVITGYGHSPEHAALYCEQLGVLIAGDMVLPRISTNVSLQPHAPDADPLGQFLDSLTRYAACGAGTLVLPSHGLPFYGLCERVERLQQHHAERLAAMQRACAEPRTGAALLPVLFERRLDPQQTFFAMGETLAHINYLQHRGQLIRTCRADGIYSYVRT